MIIGQSYGEDGFNLGSKEGCVGGRLQLLALLPSRLSSLDLPQALCRVLLSSKTEVKKLGTQTPVTHQSSPPPPLPLLISASPPSI